ncbi:MAG: PEP-CTERM sorting domain-containing protein [Microcystaceae cyanobacterium]
MNKLSFSLCLSLGSLLISLTSANAANFTVDALSDSFSTGSGMNTGLSFTIGEPLVISTDPNDLWSDGGLPRWANTDGLIKDLFATGSDESGEPAGTLIGQSFPLLEQNGFSAPYASLVGEINGTLFLIGTSFDGVAPASGTLVLYHWDRYNDDNYDNTLVRVRVTKSTPEPTALLGLIAFGVAGLMVSKRRIN